jgi:hypothetical protein
MKAHCIVSPNHVASHEDYQWPISAIAHLLSLWLGVTRPYIKLSSSSTTFLMTRLLLLALLCL